MAIVSKILRRLSVREIVALALTALLGAAVIIAVALGSRSVALALVAALTVMVFLAVLQIRRRVGEIRERLGSGLAELRNGAPGRGRLGTIEATSGTVAEKRILGAIENERLANARRHEQLMSSIGELEKRVDRLSEQLSTDNEVS